MRNAHIYDPFITFMSCLHHWRLLCRYFFFPNQCFLIIGSGVCSYFPLASGGGPGGGGGIKGGKSENHAHLKVILNVLVLSGGKGS